MQAQVLSDLREMSDMASESSSPAAGSHYHHHQLHHQRTDIIHGAAGNGNGNANGNGAAPFLASSPPPHWRQHSQFQRGFAAPAVSHPAPWLDVLSPAAAGPGAAAMSEEQGGISYSSSGSAPSPPGSRQEKLSPTFTTHPSLALPRTGESPNERFRFVPAQPRSYAAIMATPTNRAPLQGRTKEPATANGWVENGHFDMAQQQQQQQQQQQDATTVTGETVLPPATRSKVNARAEEAIAATAKYGSFASHVVPPHQPPPHPLPGRNGHQGTNDDDDNDDDDDDDDNDDHRAGIIHGDGDDEERQRLVQRIRELEGALAQSRDQDHDVQAELQQRAIQLRASQQQTESARQELQAQLEAHQLQMQRLQQEQEAKSPEAGDASAAGGARVPFAGGVGEVAAGGRHAAQQAAAKAARDDALRRMLQMGGVFVKHCAGRAARHPRYVWVSNDLKTIMTREVGQAGGRKTGAVKRFPVSRLDRVIRGHKSRVMQRKATARRSADCDHCVFSLEFRDRTLDLEVDVGGDYSVTVRTDRADA